MSVDGIGLGGSEQLLGLTRQSADRQRPVDDKKGI